MQGKLFGWACGLTTTEEEAKDLVQETLLKAWVNRDKYIENMNFKRWIYLIMRNLFINKYWEQKRHPSVSEMSEPAPLPEQEDNSLFTVECNLDFKEIWDIINTLPKKNLAVFQLYLSGFKYHEIAEMTQEPLGTVKSRIHLCRKRLKRLLKDYW